MLQQGLALASVNRKLSTVKVYAGLAAQAGIITGSDLALIKSIGGYAAKEFKRVDEKRSDGGQATRRGAKKATSTTISPEQVKALKSQPLDTPQGRRDAVLMALLLDHGLRVGELAALQVTDVNLKAGELRFYRPKVDKIQTHRLTPDALVALRAYFAHGDAPALGALLRGSQKGGELTGLGMTERSITRRVDLLGERAGVANLSAHDLRHSWATRAIRKGTDPFALQQAGGWTSMQTVRKYVDESAIANEGVRL
jgi:integrase